MDQTATRVRRRRTRVIVGALVAGLLVVLLLFPASGIDPQPPVCYSMLGFVVSCEAWVAWAAGAVVAGLVGLALWALDRRRG